MDFRFSLIGPEYDEQAVLLLAQLNSDSTLEDLRDRLATIRREHPHYFLAGAFSASGELLGVAGMWAGTKIWCGKYLEIDNFVLDQSCRSQGIGRHFMEWIEHFAAEQGCKLLTLDSYVSNHPSHRFYHRHGYEIWGFHFVKPLAGWNH
jgi:GNAT superfamily N-acetyltransferase